MNQVNKKDLQGYAFLRGKVLSTGVTPSLREIGRVVGYASPRSVQLMLERLKKRGLVSYSNGVIKLAQNMESPMEDRTMEVPLVGSVACGSPSLAEQDVEAIIDVSTRFAKPGHSYFLLRAVGTSMNKSGINDGDLVLIKQQPTAEDGERIVALINNDATIKLLYHDRENGSIVLKPNSTDKEHRPIILTEDFVVQGVVVATLPKNLY
ncbi:MAG: transcriptional repressor LexA [Patescibacteria group bacterium]|nr:transcriptional repressor LexA [Patescibacteria group bacterium]